MIANAACPDPKGQPADWPGTAARVVRGHGASARELGAGGTVCRPMRLRGAEGCQCGDASWEGDWRGSDSGAPLAGFGWEGAKGRCSGRGWKPVGSIWGWRVVSLRRRDFLKPKETEALFRKSAQTSSSRWVFEPLLSKDQVPAHVKRIPRARPRTIPPAENVKSTREISRNRTHTASRGPASPGTAGAKTLNFTPTCRGKRHAAFVAAFADPIPS